MNATNDNERGIAVAICKLILVEEDHVADAIAAIDHLTDAELDQLEAQCGYCGVDPELALEAIRCERLFRKERPDLGGGVA